MLLQAPGVGQTFQTRNGAYTSDQNALIATASGIAFLDLIGEGCTPLAFSAAANFRNLLDGGDFTVNPFQRGTTFTGITNTVTYTADRWFAVSGASSSVSVSSQAITSIPGFSTAVQVGRAAANTATSPIYFGQVIETADAIRLQGQAVTFSFWALAGANFSGTGLSVSVQYGLGSNQSAANLIAGSWTTQTYPALAVGSVNGTAGAAGAFGVGSAALQPITNGFQRYTFTAVLPNTVTQVGVLVGYTPVGTAGAADFFQIAGLQLEVGPAASAFEHRDIQVELEICQRYCWVVNEPAANVIVGMGGTVAAANTQVFYMATPVQLRAAPTVTVSVGTFKVAAGAAAATATGLAAGTTHTPNAISIVSTLTQAVGGSASLQGGGGGGTITASADL